MASQLAIGIICSGSAAALANRLGALTFDGAVAATGVGAVTYNAGGLPWAGLLLVFFVTSSALSHLSAHRPGGSTSIAAKSEPRDACQVLANGGVPALCGLLSGLFPSTIWLIPFAGGLAGATADTWASEIGGWSKRMPRHIILGRTVPHGTSGGVTWLGLGASSVASVLIAAGTLVFAGGSIRSGLGVALGGMSGSLLDSVFGATVQERRYCPICQLSTEQVRHARCGATTYVSGGVRGMNNDMVNFVSCLLASLVSVLIAVLVHAI